MEMHRNRETGTKRRSGGKDRLSIATTAGHKEGREDWLGFGGKQVKAQGYGRKMWVVDEVDSAGGTLPDEESRVKDTADGRDPARVRRLGRTMAREAKDAKVVNRKNEAGTDRDRRQ